MSLIVGNWKMALGVMGSEELASATVQFSRELTSTEVWIAPSPVAIERAGKVVRESRVSLGSQNVWAPSGAFTGETGASQLRELGCTFAIVGHSERRHVFGESIDLSIGRALAGLEGDLVVIFCVGETLPERESGTTLSVIDEQFLPLLSQLKGNHLEHLIIAYEPVWAIGTGKVAALAEIEEVHRHILSRLENANVSSPTILYGGSVNPQNVKEILDLDCVHGALVGGASQDATKFEALARAAEA